MRPQRLWQVLIVLVLCLFVTSVAAQAQGSLTDVRVYDVSSAQFPTVRIRVAPVASGGAVAEGLAGDAFRVYEDGIQRPVDEAKNIEVGAQVAIVLDASGSMNSTGATGKLASLEAIEAIDDLVYTDKWFNRNSALDWFMLIVPKGEKDFQVAQEWVNQYIPIHNKAYVFDFKAQKGFTPLYAMLVEAMARMKDAPGYEKRSKFLVVLSDGIDNTSPQDIADVINRADKLGVKILAIEVGPVGAGAAKNLQRLAAETGGAFASYKGTESLRGLFSQIRSQRTQFELSYRSAMASTGKHTVQVGVMSGGRETRSLNTEVPITIVAPAVRIIEPLPSAVFRRQANRWDVDPKTIEPRQAPVQIEVLWPDGHPRAVQQVAYIVDGVTVATQRQDQPFNWDISGLSGGAHSLVVEVKDELGLIGRSDPLQATITLVIPPAPTATPIAPVIETIIETRTASLSLLTAAALAIAGIALLIALYVMLKYRVPQRVVSAVGDAAKAATDLIDHRRGKRGTRSNARASLILQNEDGTHGREYPLTSQTTTIGRNPERAMLVLDDQTVSRLHAKIVEETDGIFHIYDEGGSQGTYVNTEEVTAAGRRLMTQDVVEMGRLRFIFQAQVRNESTETEPGRARSRPVSATPPGGQKARPTGSGIDRDDTEPFVKR